MSRVVAVTLLAMMLVACGHEEPPAPEPPPVYVERATAHDLVDRIEATGQLLAKAEAVVAAQVGGQVTDVRIDEGGAVEAGGIVIEIDPERRELELSNAAARVVQAEAQLDEARRESTRIEKLYARGAASQSQLDEAQTQLELARSRLVAEQAQHGLAKRALGDASVAAPFTGLVSRRYVNAGEYVQPGSRLFHLVALDPVEVEFFLSEVDSSRVAVGQEVAVRVSSQPGEVFRAAVSVVSPTIDPQTRTRRVKAVLSNPEGKLLPGTFARVDVGVARRTGVVMIPKEAVQVGADGSVLFRLVGADRVERLRVETGTFREGLVEVRGPVAPGDWIVVRGQAALFDGSPVSLRRPDGTAATVPGDGRAVSAEPLGGEPTGGAGKGGGT
jgi:membrane fusion protein (multidrug efflux system)